MSSTFSIPAWLRRAAWRGLGWALLLPCSLMAASPISARYVASPEAGWPQFRGPWRNGASQETNLLQSWPEGGPQMLWSSTNLGSGYSCPIISGNTIWITGDIGEELHIFALDLEGRVRWTATNGASWKNPYPGARAACTFSAGRLFHMNAHGQVACFDAPTGRLLWSADVIKEFESRVPTWATAECLLVDGQRVIVTPGGKKASMAALDRNTGKPVWLSEPLPSAEPNKIEGPAYASPILAEVGGQRVVVGMAARHCFGADAVTGRLQWSFEMPTQYEVLASPPALCGDAVFVTGPDAGGGKLLRFVRDGTRLGVERAWTTSFDTCHGGIIPLDGYLYGSWYREFNGWGCVNLKDGSVPYRDRTLAMGSAIYADGRLYCLSQTGTMALVKPEPGSWRIISRFQFVTERRSDVWAHPVILDGRLYLRHQQTLYCYDIRESTARRAR